MPRAKVLPENRKRSVQACVPCRNSKVRCDAQQPCQGCKKRGKPEACIFDTPYQHSHSRRISTTSRQDPGSGLTETSTSSPVDIPDADVGTEHSANDAGSSDETWQPGSHKTRSRMLLSSKGEQLYLGGTASISYLQFIRHVLRRQAGPSAFTESGTNNVMLEVDSSPHGSIEEIGQLDVEHQKALIQCYFEATSAILDLFSKDDIYSALSFENIVGGERRRDRRATQAIYHMVLAIGGQCRGIYPTDTKFAAHFFARAQRFAFEGFLCDPSMNMIKLFLLMAFYMLGACRRNAAFMYLGIASKAANALGLHRKDQYRVLPKADGAERLRTWKSLCVLDTIVSSILGRPGNFSSVWHDDLESSPGSERDSRPASLAIDATYEMSCLVDSMESRLWSSKSVESQPAEDFLHELRKWSQKLPPELRRFSSDNMFISSAADRELLVGAAHVACVYYFAVILVTRPFLTSHIMLTLRDRARKTRSDAFGSASTSSERTKVANLAQVCVESAIYMATMAHRAMDAGILLRNMCLLKAWIFAAGLLLGFSLFASDSETPETASAFSSARSVLNNLAELSPQARHYYEILTSFSDAITKSRQARLDEKRKVTNQFIDQIFTIDLKRSSPGEAPYLSPDSGMDVLGHGAEGAPEGVSEDFDFEAAFAMPGFSVDDAANLPMLWDDFSVDWPQMDEGMYFDCG